MVIRHSRQKQPSAETAQLLPRSTRFASVAELHIQRSGFILDQWSCAISFQAVIPDCACFTLQRGSKDLLSYTTPRGATDKRVLFSEDRITTFYVDQTDSQSVQSLWNDVNLDDFDVMIDDGLHTFEAGICLLENSYSRLAANGVYIIEDVLQNDAPKYHQWLESRGYMHDLIMLHRKNSDLGGNILILIRKP